jgi:hypothetical protein
LVVFGQGRLLILFPEEGFGRFGGFRVHSS